MWLEANFKDLEAAWQPELVFMNAVSVVEMQDVELRRCPWRMGKGKETVMEWRADCRGTFQEDFELRHFPLLGV